MTLTGPVISMIIPNVGGWAGGYITAKQVKKDGWYDTLDKPKWTPPNWVFGPAWTILYSGMGYASWLVYKECGGFTEEAAVPMALYGTQLALNWAWSPIFFYKHELKWAFFEIVTLTGAAAITAVSFHLKVPAAGYLLLPYLAWLGFASALNYSVWKRNEPTAKITEIVEEVKKN